VSGDLATHQSGKPSWRALVFWSWPMVPVIAALAFTAILLVVFDTSPATALQAMYQGALGSASKRLSVIAFWIPLVLASSGLLITFRAGLWNIGIEGQIILGAIGASWIALSLDLPPVLQIGLELLAAIAAGALWAFLGAVLKTRGHVHEIFGGLALNSLAIILTNYLISGPWQPPEGGTFRGTAPFHENALLPLYNDSRFAPLSLILALLSIVLVIIALRGTFWGLKLKALGKNPHSAFLLGVSSEREIFLAMMFCGALAGLGGAVRTISWFDSLRQSISGGIGFTALLVVMLANYNMWLVPFIAIFFSAVLQGSITLQLRTQLHSSLGGILTGVMVLFVLLFSDPRRVGLRSSRASEEHGPPEVKSQPLDTIGPDSPEAGHER
jgi:simple sugar transport system permease protein